MGCFRAEQNTNKQPPARRFRLESSAYYGPITAAILYAFGFEFNRKLLEVCSPCSIYLSNSICMTLAILFLFHLARSSSRKALNKSKTGFCQLRLHLSITGCHTCHRHPKLDESIPVTKNSQHSRTGFAKSHGIFQFRARAHHREPRSAVSTAKMVLCKKKNSQ